MGVAELQARQPAFHARAKSTLNIDGETAGVAARAPCSAASRQAAARQFMLILQVAGPHHGLGYQNGLDSVGLVYHEADEAEVVALVRDLLQETNVLQKSGRAGQSRSAHGALAHVRPLLEPTSIPHERAREELDFIAASIRDREMLKAEGLTIKRGLLLSGPAGRRQVDRDRMLRQQRRRRGDDHHRRSGRPHPRPSTISRRCSAPSVVILEDLDLMTKSRQSLYGMTGKDDVTGELLQVLSGGSAYADIVTIATTNHPEAIDDALAKRAGRFDAHVRMGYPERRDEAAHPRTLSRPVRRRRTN